MECFISNVRRMTSVTISLRYQTPFIASIIHACLVHRASDNKINTNCSLVPPSNYAGTEDPGNNCQLKYKYQFICKFKEIKTPAKSTNIDDNEDADNETAKATLPNCESQSIKFQLALLVVMCWICSQGFADGNSAVLVNFKRIELLSYKIFFCRHHECQSDVRAGM